MTKAPSPALAALASTPHVVAINPRYALNKDGTGGVRLQVETDLSLDVLSPDHDRKAVDAVLAACTAFLQKHSAVLDGIDVVEAGPAYLAIG